MKSENVLTPEEARQLKAIQEAVRARRPKGRDKQALLNDGVDDALSAIHSIGTGGIQYAVSLADAAKSIQKLGAGW